MAGWFPELVDAKAWSLTYPAINAHRDRIEELLDAGVTLTTAHQRLCDEHGLAVGTSSCRRYVWLEFPQRPASERVTVLRPPVPPGSEAQIDYGYLGSWLDPVIERLRKVWAFVFVLACSRHMFVRQELGELRLEVTVLHSADDPEQKLVLFTPPPEDRARLVALHR